MAGTFSWGNRTWGPGQRAAFAKYLLAHGGVQYNAWARNHPAAAALLGGGGVPAKAAPTPMEAASTQADALLSPDIAALESGRAADQASSARSMENTKGIYAALADMLKGIGPETAGIYQNAAGTQSAMARGFADAQEAQQSGAATDMSSFLEHIGAPKDQIDQVMGKVGGSAVGDVVYGAGGAIPASTLNREGAAFGAAAARLPAQAIGTGMEGIQRQAGAAQVADTGWLDKLAAKRGEKSGLVQQIMDKNAENARAERALRIQEKYYGLSVTKADNAQVSQVKADKIAAAKAKTAGGKERDAAFASARQNMFDDAKGLSKPMTADERFQWALDHGKSISAAPHAHKPSYAQAKQTMFNQYKDLLRYATRAGKAALKRRLNQMIDEALASVGIVPGKPPKKSTAKQDVAKIASIYGWSK